MGTGDIYRYSLQGLQNAYAQGVYATNQMYQISQDDNWVSATSTITTTPTTPANKTLLLLEDV